MWIIYDIVLVVVIFFKGWGLTDLAELPGKSFSLRDEPTVTNCIFTYFRFSLSRKILV